MRARREVILSSGDFGSPQLLMLSGVGAGADLQRLLAIGAYAVPLADAAGSQTKSGQGQPITMSAAAGHGARG